MLPIHVLNLHCIKGSLANGSKESVEMAHFFSKALVTSLKLFFSPLLISLFIIKIRIEYRLKESDVVHKDDTQPIIRRPPILGMLALERIMIFIVFVLPVNLEDVTKTALRIFSWTRLL